MNDERGRRKGRVQVAGYRGQDRKAGSRCQVSGVGGGGGSAMANWKFKIPEGKRRSQQ